MDGRVLLQNHRGQVAVMREVLMALLDAHPGRGAVLERALTNATLLREHAVNSRQEDAVLAGMDAELQFFRGRLRQMPPASAP